MLADYDRVLKQRTALLKSAKARGVRGDGLSTLDVWDDKLVSLGTQVIEARLALAAELADPLAHAYAAIAGADHRPELQWALSVTGGDPEEGSDAATTDTAPAQIADSSARPSPRDGPLSSIAASRSSARIATTPFCGCAGFR